MRQQTPLSEVSNALGLSDSDVRQLREIGINGVADLLGLIYSAFDELAEELHIPRGALEKISQELRRYVDPDTLHQIEDIHNSMASLPTASSVPSVPLWLTAPSTHKIA